MNLAVIPARGGSKRIPRKNILPFCGRPMIAWSIRAALESGCFERVIVSTDDSEIAEISRAQGADVPFMRPHNLADDHTGTTAVMAHALKWQQENGDTPEYVCCIYATAPFVQPEYLRYGLELLRGTDAEYAISVTSFAFPIQRAVRITAENRIEMFEPQCFESRSQDLEEAWHDAGQFYWGRSEAWLRERPVLGTGTVPVRLPRYRVQDIDTQEDLQRAELLFKALHCASEG